ncbi:MAG: hypothetical protein ACLSVX_02185 [Massilimicrobiota timonensis]
MALVMSVSVLTAGMPVVEAKPASYNKLTSEEKKAFDKLYKETSTSKLQSVSVSYSSSISGKSDVNQYRWTAWRNDTKNSTINKKANNGNGNYSGFTKKKVQSWSRNDTYINAIKELNNGKFPATKDYKYPTTTSGDTLDFWMGEPGFYSILGDPRYKNITLKGYRTYKWTEKIKKTKTEWKEKKTVNKKQYTKKSSPNSYGFGPRSVTELANTLKTRLLSRPFSIKLTNSESKRLANKLINSLEENTGGTNISYYEMSSSYTASISNGTANISIYIGGYSSDDVTPEIVDIKVTKKTKEKVTKTWYETKSHTKKQQIAQTVVAKNTYATQIQKYGTFYLTPKSNVKSNTIKQRNTGFWGSVKPSYHQGSPKTQDQGNYTWTFSTNVSSGKKSYNLYASITQKYKFVEDIADNLTNVPNNDIPNPPSNPNDPLPNVSNNPGGGNDNSGGNNPGGGNNNNPGGEGNNGGNNPDNPSNPDGNNNGGSNNPNNPGGNNGGNNNYDPTDPSNPDKIGDKDNPPMINIEIEIDKGITTKKLPTMVHLYDIYQR